MVNYQLRRSLFSQTSSNINNRTLTSHHFDKILQPYTHYTIFFYLFCLSPSRLTHSAVVVKKISREKTILRGFIISCDTRKSFRSFTGLWNRRPLNVLNDTKLILGKVHIFWEGHKNFAKSSPYFWLALHKTKVRWRFRKNFVVFSEYMNFTKISKFLKLNRNTIPPRKKIRSQKRPKMQIRMKPRFYLHFFLHFVLIIKNFFIKFHIFQEDHKIFAKSSPYFCPM